MKEITTKRLLLRPFRESDRDDLLEFLLQLKDDEFEGYRDISFENGLKYLRERMDSGEYYAVVLLKTGKVIGNIYCGNRAFDAKEVGYKIVEGEDGPILLPFFDKGVRYFTIEGPNKEKIEFNQKL